jgi:hypothetical protein
MESSSTFLEQSTKVCGDEERMFGSALRAVDAVRVSSFSGACEYSVHVVYYRQLNDMSVGNIFDDEARLVVLEDDAGLRGSVERVKC